MPRFIMLPFPKDWVGPEIQEEGVEGVSDLYQESIKMYLHSRDHALYTFFILLFSLKHCVLSFPLYFQIISSILTVTLKAVYGLIVI